MAVPARIPGGRGRARGAGRGGWRQGRVDHGGDRAGRRLSGGVAAQEGLRGARGEAARVVVQHRPGRSSVPRPARARDPVLFAPRRPDRCHQPDPPGPGDPARRDLQSGGAEPRPGQLRDRRVHRERRCAGHAAPARGGAHPGPGRAHALLSGLDLGAVRPGAGAAARDHAVLPAQPLCGRQALRVLDHGQLPRGLRPSRLERHPVQPREPAARRDLRHPQGHAARSRRSRSACRSGCTWATSMPGATGAMPATTSRACGGSCSRTQPDDYVLATGEAHSVRELVELAFACIEREIVWRGRGLDEVGPVRRLRGRAGPGRPALFPADRGRSAAGRSRQGAHAARLAPSHELCRAGARDGRGRSGAGAPAGRPRRSAERIRIDAGAGGAHRPARAARIS